MSFYTTPLGALKGSAVLYLLRQYSQYIYDMILRLCESRALTKCLNE